MSSTAPQIRKKLYFDLAFTGTRQIVLCTQFRTGVTINERFNGALQALEALTGSSSGVSKAQREVEARFVPAGLTNAALATSLTSVAAPFWLDFIGATIGNGTGGISRLPYLTVGGTVFQKAGQSAVFGTTGILRHFAVRVRRTGTNTTTVRGTLYVGRQHSIEV